MEPHRQLAPPVVAVVIVHEPGPWFDETLSALRAQDYPNLRTLFLVTPDGIDDDGASFASIRERIVAHLPGAFVRELEANAGFGPAANEVLHLVEGDNGLFLFAHDDVAPEPDALRAMVEEMYRSNAAAVGPKLVDWDDPSELQAVGLGLDRFGEIEPVVEPGERDQEQHDGVRDVFVLPSAFMLVRADLFRRLGGFDPAITFHREDVELCWRLHHSGARVVVVPAARVRHRSLLDERRPDLPHGLLSARHRMRTVATMTGATRLPGRSVELVVLTIVELVVGLFTGRFGDAWNSLRGLFGLIGRTPALLARRRQVAPMRQVPEREVYSLQSRGSARLNSYLRNREHAGELAVDDAHFRRWRQSASAPTIAWLLVVVGVIVGGRHFVANGIAPVGEFFAFPDSPADLARTYLSGWNPNGPGATSPNPTGWALLAIGSVFTVFHMGLLQTVAVLGAVVAGVAGLWRLSAVFVSSRARVVALVVYAASPLVSGAMSAGRLSVLVVYAATPWFIHLTGRAAGIGVVDARRHAVGALDGVVELPLDERFRRTVGAALVLGVAVAFAPVMLPVALAVVVVIVLGSLIALAPWRAAIWWLACGAGACVGAALLNVPWTTAWTWEGVVGAVPIGQAGHGLVVLGSFDIGRTGFTTLALAWYLPVVAAIVLARAWRLTWAVRAGVLVVAFGGLAVLGDRGSLPIDLPESGVVLVPVAIGLALAAAAVVAAFDLDVRGGSFGWRQPLGGLSILAVIVGVIPGVGALASGDFDTPTMPLARLLDASLPPPGDDGDYRVLLIGDARLLPVPSTSYRDGVSWAIVDDGPFDARDRWMSPPNSAAELVTTALDQMTSASTLRAGRLLAPLGIRYIVVPEFDGVRSTVNDPLPAPQGLIDALADQLDLAAIRPSLPTLDVFVNQTWLPTQALLTGETADASHRAGADVLVRADLSSSTPAFIGADANSIAHDQVEAGVVALAVPFSREWTLQVDGESIPARRSFGEVTAFDVAASGRGELRYASPTSRHLAVALQIVLWIAACAVAGRVRLPTPRRRPRGTTDDALLDLSAESPREVFDPGFTYDAPAAPAVSTAPIVSPLPPPMPGTPDGDEIGTDGPAGEQEGTP